MTMRPLALLSFALAFLGCTPALKQDARAVVHLAPEACIVIEQVTPSPAVAEGCVLAKDLQPFFDHLLAAQRAAASKIASEAALQSDAGSK